jgi:hypothetical protein
MNEDRVLPNLKCNEKTGEIAYAEIGIRSFYPTGNQSRPFTPMTVSLIKRDLLPRDSLYHCAIPSRSKFLVTLDSTKVASYVWRA